MSSLSSFVSSFLRICSILNEKVCFLESPEKSFVLFLSISVNNFCQLVKCPEINKIAITIKLRLLNCEREGDTNSTNKN